MLECRILMAPRIPTDEEAVPLSVLLRTLPDPGGKTVTVAEIIRHFGPRAFGALLFVFALPETGIGARGPAQALPRGLPPGRVTPWLPAVSPIA